MTSRPEVIVELASSISSSSSSVLISSSSKVKPSSRIRCLRRRSGDASRYLADVSRTHRIPSHQIGGCRVLTVAPYDAFSTRLGPGGFSGVAVDAPCGADRRRLTRSARLVDVLASATQRDLPGGLENDVVVRCLVPCFEASFLRHVHVEIGRAGVLAGQHPLVDRSHGATTLRPLRVPERERTTYPSRFSQSRELRPRAVGPRTVLEEPVCMSPLPRVSSELRPTEEAAGRI